MRHVGKHFILETMPKQKRPFLVARWATATLATGVSDEKLFATILAFDAGKSFFQVAAFQKLVDRRSDHRTPEAILFLVPLRIYFLKLFETFPDDTEKRRGFRISRLIER
jgi:hypothetical protein